VLLAEVSDEHRPLLHHVSALTSGGARVHRVAVVEAAADRVAFDDLDAHVGTRGRTDVSFEK